MKFFDAHNIFPEYFVISVPLFNDVIKDELDEWLYMMKHSEVKEDFKSPYMKKVADRLNILKMSPAERKEYTAYRNESLKERDYIVSAEEKGIEIGKAEGKAEGIEIGEARLREEKNMIARAMLLDGDSVEKIARITGLSVEKINELKS
jgi:predicted transposase/invertase (TIGR01784 family)